MAVFFTEVHAADLSFLLPHTPETVLMFAKEAVNYLVKGPNPQDYGNFAKTFLVSAEEVQNALESFAYILLECYKYNVDENELRKIFAAANFSDKQITSLLEFYELHKLKIGKIFNRSDIDSFFYDLQWRFEAKIGSRSLLNQMTPLITLNLKTSNSPKAALTDKVTNCLLQTDPNTLVQITNKLEKALQCYQSHNTRKIEKKIRNLIPEDV